MIGVRSNRVRSQIHLEIKKVRVRFSTYLFLITAIPAYIFAQNCPVGSPCQSTVTCACSGYSYPAVCCAPPIPNAISSACSSNPGCTGCAKCCTTYTLPGSNPATSCSSGSCLNNTYCASVQRPRKTFAKLVEILKPFSKPANARMSFLDAQELPTSTGSSANDATASIPVTLGGAKTETRLLDASIDIMADGRPKYNFRILNSASLAVAAYEVRWTLFNAKGEQVGFSSTTETAVPTAIIEPNQVYMPPAGGSCMIFKGFQMERATAELTYYELLDGSIYDSQTTKFGSSRKS